MTVVRIIIAIVIAIVVTLIFGPMTIGFGTYGVWGVYYAFQQHVAWSLAAMVYWMLLLLTIPCAAVVVGAWVFVFTRRKPVRPIRFPNFSRQR